MVLVEDDIVVSHLIQGVPGGAVAQDGGVALDEGVQTLLRDQIGGDALDLLRRAAVESGEGDGPGEPLLMVWKKFLVINVVQKEL